MIYTDNEYIGWNITKSTQKLCLHTILPLNKYTTKNFLENVGHSSGPKIPEFYFLSGTLYNQNCYYKKLFITMLYSIETLLSKRGIWGNQNISIKFLYKKYIIKQNLIFLVYKDFRCPQLKNLYNKVIMSWHLDFKSFLISSFNGIMASGLLPSSKWTVIGFG